MHICMYVCVCACVCVCESINIITASDSYEYYHSSAYTHNLIIITMPDVYGRGPDPMCPLGCQGDPSSPETVADEAQNGTSRSRIVHASRIPTSPS